MTTNQGYPISDDNSSLTVGNRGPTLLQDFQFIEKIAHFDRERIPERVVHAKGAGAFGYFQVHKSMAKYTKAKFLQDPNAKTPVFVRFSTVAGSRGSADTVRDVRGFATKFYTQEGNYDLVGNDIPVFFIRDAMKFPDLVHSVKAEPHNNMPSSSTGHNNFWDFISLTPESTHMLTWVFSDRGTPASYRMIEGFGVNTYKWVSNEGKAALIKYHWKPKLGVKNFDRLEATRIAGEDPDYLTRDLWEAIERGEFVEYEFFVQMMDIAEEQNQTFDPLDPTKTWPEDKFPLMPVGKMVLDRNPENFFTQVEQAAFCPANLVPGIEFSDDKLLQGRTFSYVDTQRYRLGANFHKLPTNRPLSPRGEQPARWSHAVPGVPGAGELWAQQPGRTGDDSAGGHALQPPYSGEPGSGEDQEDGRLHPGRGEIPLHEQDGDEASGGEPGGRSEPRHRSGHPEASCREPEESG